MSEEISVREEDLSATDMASSFIFALPTPPPSPGTEQLIRPCYRHSLSPLSGVLLTSARAQMVGAWSSLHRRSSDFESGTDGAGLADGSAYANRGSAESEAIAEASMARGVGRCRWRVDRE
jgi:hypothetical protein